MSAGGPGSSQFRDPEDEEENSATERSPLFGDSSSRRPSRSQRSSTHSTQPERSRSSILNNGTPGEGPLAVRRQRFTFWQIVLRNFTIPRIIWLLLTAIGYVVFYSITDNTKGDDGIRPLDTHVDSGKKDADGQIIWKPNLERNPLYKWLVISSIILLILLMLEDMNVGLCMFIIAFKLWLFGCVGGGTELWKGLISGAVILYAALFVIACAFAETQVLEKVIGRLVGRPLSIFGMLRLLVPIIVLSSVLNNGPITAIGIPIAVSVADRVGIYTPAVFIMAMPFAATLGGSITTIGSSPNYAAQEFINDENVAHGGKWRCLATEALIAFSDREEEVLDSTSKGDAAGNEENDADTPKPRSSFNVPQELDAAFKALSLSAYPSYRLAKHVQKLSDAYARKENQRFNNCSVMRGKELSPNGEKKQKLPLDADLPPREEKASKLCYQLEQCIGFFFEAATDQQAVLCKVETLEDIRHLNYVDLTNQLPAAQLVASAGSTAFLKSFEYNADGNPVRKRKHWNRVDTKLAWEQLEAALQNPATGNRERAAELLARIKGRCDFKVVEPVFVLAGLTAAIFGVGGLLYAMWALSRMYPREQRNTDDSSEDHGSVASDSASEIELTGVEPFARRSRGSNQGEVSAKTGGDDDAMFREQGEADGAPNGTTTRMETQLSIESESSSDEGDPVRQTAAAEYEVELLLTGDMVLEPFQQSALRFFKGVTILSYNGATVFSKRRMMEVGDVVRVRGRAEMLAKLRRQMPGLVPNAELYEFLGRSRKNRLLYQVSLSRTAFEGLSDRAFFADYDACVIGKDELTHMILVEAFAEFSKSTDFQLVTAVANSTPPRSTSKTDKWRGYIILILFFSVVLLNIVGSLVKPMKTFKDDFNMYLWMVALFAIFIRAITFKQALASQNGATLLLFAFSGPVAAAMEKTGVSALIAEAIQNGSAGSRPLAILLIYVIVAILTQFIDNRTLVTMLMLPVVDVCLKMRMPVVPLMTVLVNAAVANFMSPIGCSHNQFATMAANYSFLDFIKAGWALQLLHLVAVCTFVIVWVEVSMHHKEDTSAVWPTTLGGAAVVVESEMN